MIIIADALASLRPNSSFVMRGEEISEWLDESTSPPTRAELDAEVIRLQADFDAKQYQRDRAIEYPNIGDQLDALYHAGVFPDDMAAKLKAVKDANPKG